MQSEFSSQEKLQANRLSELQNGSANFEKTVFHSKQRQTLKSFSNGLDAFANFAKIRV